MPRFDIDRQHLGKKLKHLSCKKVTGKALLTKLKIVFAYLS